MNIYNRRFPIAGMTILKLWTNNAFLSVVGPDGSQWKALQLETGCSITFIPNGTGTLMCNIKGEKELRV